MARRFEDRGQAVPAVALVVVVLVIAMLGVARIGGAAAARARARTAADASALAAVVDDDAAAWSVAERNGATLLRLTRSDGAVEVVVEVDGTRAVARARRETGPP
jgi:hypothetical protein